MTTDNNELKPYTLDEYLKPTAFPEREWLIEGLLGKEEFTLLSGSAKVGKSLLAANLGLALAAGGKFMGQYVCKKSRVLVIQTEISNVAYRDRLLKMLPVLDADRQEFLILSKRILIDQREGTEMLSRIIESAKPNLTILDPFYTMHRGDEDKASVIAPLLTNIKEAVLGHGSSCLLVHHQGKKGESLGRQVGHKHRGSSAFGDVPDSSWSLVGGANGQTTLSFELRNGPAPAPISLKRNDETLCWYAENLVISSISLDPVVMIVSKQPGITSGVLKEQLCQQDGISNRTADERVKAALEGGLIGKKKEGTRALFYPINPQVRNSLGDCEVAQKPARFAFDAPQAF